MKNPPWTMPKSIREFLVQVMVAENPGAVSDPSLTEEDRKHWVRLWPGWKLMQLAGSRTLAAECGMSDVERARLTDFVRRLDRLTYAGRGAKTPLDADAALFAQAVWAPASIESVTGAEEGDGDSTSRADPPRRSTGR